MKQLIFIVGSGRSGTTLLRNMLERHPNIAVAPELKFFDEFLARHPDRSDTYFQTHKEMLINEVITHLTHSGDPLKTAGLGREKIQETCRKATSFREFFVLLATLLSHGENARVVVEKTPMNVHFLSDIREMFPEARFVHMIRDGREFAASAMKRGWTSRITEVCALWLNALRDCDRFRKSHPELVHELKYESLVENPIDTLTHLFSFIGVDVPDEEFFDFNDLPSFSSFFKREHAGLYQSRHFTTYFSPQKQIYIENALGDTLRRKGYHTEQAGSWSPGVTFQIFKHRLLNALRRKGYIKRYELLKKLWKHR